MNFLENVFERSNQRYSTLNSTHLNYTNCMLDIEYIGQWTTHHGFENILLFKYSSWNFPGK